MKAIVHKGFNDLSSIYMTEMKENSPKKGEVKIQLKAAGLNHRDLLIPNRRSEEDPALILGSDGAGIIQQLGEGVTNVQVGDEVVINPGIGWKENSEAPPDGFEILGMPAHGTFAETVVVPVESVARKPQFLTWEESAVMPLAALTAYRVVFTRAKVKEGQTVFIPGIGSGVATYILQYVKALGAKAIVSSRQEDKLSMAKKLGADLAIHTNSNWDDELSNEHIDIVIECIGAATFNRSLSQLRKGGTIVAFGASAGDEVKLDLRSFFYGQYNLLGSTMGSHEEFLEMLTFIEKHNIKPIIDKVFPLEEGKAAFEYLESAKQFGKVAIKIAE
ncbi:zinc-binding alcohol dehydrogenase/oxidoreductase [Salirhabdus euzebyi]|uniref:Zinc-binding alcohol dehydrogenase/oxidoreductase n=1 Tax=Salirhabdus euzebyi TaxID=394506 RepID=A0A841Q8C2_9BACI|nr:zinc-binding dehydrogenase [Salirhabdus euzebyi]MBB6454635.1 zinc-binding alcohol dehydrogenase/oxidoreductase [Salirhabdus euzebyi]